MNIVKISLKVLLAKYFKVITASDSKVKQYHVVVTLLVSRLVWLFGKSQNLNLGLPGASPKENPSNTTFK